MSATKGGKVTPLSKRRATPVMERKFSTFFFAFKENLSNPFIFNISESSGVSIIMMGAIITLELEVTQEGIQVTSLQNGATEALQDMVTKFFTLRQLITRLQNGGVDFFPADDTPNVIEGSCCKLPALELHLYHCMAHLCTSYNFMWSRWNVTAGRRAIVQQVREHVYSPSDIYDILHVTPEFAAYVSTTEVSPEYNATPLEDMKFYPDLFSLVEKHCSNDVKALVMGIPWKLVETVKDLMWAMKPFSYS